MYPSEQTHLEEEGKTYEKHIKNQKFVLIKQ